jgi:hypothetical protein
MKKIVFILCFFLLAIFCFAQTGQVPCSAFKTGKFMYRDTLNTIIMVTRKNKKQKEYDAKNDIITKFKLKWTGDCEYQLTQLWSNNKVKRKQNRKVSRVVITKTNGNDSYEYNCGCADPAVKVSSAGIMMRIKN